MKTYLLGKNGVLTLAREWSRQGTERVADWQQLVEVVQRVETLADAKARQRLRLGTEAQALMRFNELARLAQDIRERGELARVELALIPRFPDDYLQPFEARSAE